MSGSLRRILALLLCLCALLSPAAAEKDSGDPLASFTLHHGDRNSPKIAITVDDCYKTAREWILMRWSVKLSADCAWKKQSFSLKAALKDIPRKKEAGIGKY